MKKILIATGGSGGHVIPSLSIYDALKEEFEIHIATDLRGSRYINNKKYNNITEGLIKLCWMSCKIFSKF